MTAERGPLAGLVSEPAERLYRRLLLTGGVPTDGDGVSLADPAVVELLDAGIAFRSGEADVVLRPVSMATALRTLLERRHRELGELQRQMIDGWSKLTEHLPSTVDAGGGARAGGGVRLLTDVREISTIAAELWRTPTSRFRGTETGAFPTRPTADRVFTPPRSAIERGVRFQMIYQADYRTTSWGNEIIDRSAAAGEEIRLREQVPAKLFHVDDAVALVATDRVAKTALLVRSPALVSLIAEWFDAMWADSSSVAIGGAVDVGLTEQQQRVLQQMLLGHADEVIARQLQVSVRTVRRHITVIYEQLGVNSRFAAGVAAAKAGWL